MRTVGDVMTRSPLGVECDQSLEEAVELMEERGVRHLLVLDRARLIGVLSDRDVLRLESRKRVSPSVMAVSEAMVPDPIVADHDELLAKVLARMTTAGADVVVVLRHGVPVGIFTTSDAVQILRRAEEAKPARGALKG